MNTGTEKAALTVENLRVSYGNTAVIRDISFTIAPGEIIALMGQSGCGKTTLVRTIAGLQPYTGTITFQGVDAAGLSRPARARVVQAIFQNPYTALNPALTVERLLAEPLRIHAGANKSRTNFSAAVQRAGKNAKRLLARTGGRSSDEFTSPGSGDKIEDDRIPSSTADRFSKEFSEMPSQYAYADAPSTSPYCGFSLAGHIKASVRKMLLALDLSPSYAARRVSELSGGERQRVAIGCALMRPVPLIVADEICSALDILIQERVLSFLSSHLAASRAACLFVTHDPGTAAAFCTRTIRMSRGILR